MRRPFLVVFLVVWASVSVAAGEEEVPRVVVERHWVHGDRAERITLFDNMMAVTTVQEKGVQVFLRQIMLGEDEYKIYLKAFGEVASEAGTGDSDPLAAIDSGATVFIDLPGFSPSTFSYSPLQVLDIQTARMVAGLDDLQKRVSEASPSQEALRLWEPAVGDVVELYVGGTATVTEVREDGLLVLEKTETGIILAVPLQEWSVIIMKVLPR